MQSLWPKDEYVEAAAKLTGQFPDPLHVDQFIDCDTTVISPDGETAAVLRRDVIPPHLHMLAFELLNTVNMPISNRPSAMGTKPMARSVGLDGTPSLRSGVNKRVLDVSEARQGILGWDRPHHQTPLTRAHPEMLLGNEQLIKLVDELYKQFLPVFYARQRAAIANVPRYRLFGTCFSTIYIPKNFRSAYHRDRNNLTDVMTCLMPMGKFSGGELVLPRWRVAFAFRPGDLLFFDPEQLHGNLPFRGPRLSAAFYCGGWIAKCSG